MLFVVFTFIVAHNILYIYGAFPHAVGVIRAGRYRAVYLWAGGDCRIGRRRDAGRSASQSLTVMSIVIFALAAVLLASGEG